MSSLKHPICWFVDAGNIDKVDVMPSSSKDSINFKLMYAALWYWILMRMFLCHYCLVRWCHACQSHFRSLFLDWELIWRAWSFCLMRNLSHFINILLFSLFYICEEDAVPPEQRNTKGLPFLWRNGRPSGVFVVARCVQTNKHSTNKHK